MRGLHGNLHRRGGRETTHTTTVLGTAIVAMLFTLGRTAFIADLKMEFDDCSETEGHDYGHHSQQAPGLQGGCMYFDQIHHT